MQKTAYILVLAVVFSMAVSAQQHTARPEGKSLLVFTKNGKGYVHENIPASIAAIQNIGKEEGWRIDTSNDPSIFSDDQLKSYDAIVFSNTNNDVFDTPQQKIAFMRYIQAGGGFAGIHSASGTERNWKWFKLMLGASFLRHPPFQRFRVFVADKNHVATKKLPLSWETSDECYYFKEFNAAVHVLLVSDISAIEEPGKHSKPDTFGNRYPAAWCHEFDGGRIWYTALGHHKGDYAEPVYLLHLAEGLKWVVDKARPDYSKARATSVEVNEMELFN